ncbi:MAG: hypothetical protein ACOC1X_03690 [Promethearchaeota archaeon]
MEITEAQQIFKDIEQLPNKELINQFIIKASNYAKTRVEWYVAEVEEKHEVNSIRTRSHNVFIDYCNILSREMKKQGLDNAWRKRLGDDRKRIGDFACYVVAIVGIRAR